MEDDPEQSYQLGKLQFTLDYDFQKAQLSVGVTQASDLPGVDMAGSTDPYVKVYVLPEKKKIFETKVHRQTLNPVFNETFVFRVKYEVIANKVLVFAVYDFDRFSAHDVIGMVKVKLADVDLGRVLEEWRDIFPPDPDDDAPKDLGDICLSLHYVPSAGQLRVVIVEAKNLKRMKPEEMKKNTKAEDSDSEEEVAVDLKTKILQQVMEKRKLAIATAFDQFNKLKPTKPEIDPFVKITINLPDGIKMKSKTTVKKDSTNPYFNETFTFDIDVSQIQKLTCIITVMDRGKFKLCEAIGRVVLGCNTSGNPLRHWSDMLANPRRSIAQWHKLIEPPVKEFLK